MTTWESDVLTRIGAIQDDLRDILAAEDDIQDQLDLIANDLRLITHTNETDHHF